MSPISRLLGDNPVWSGTGSKPSCNCAIPTPGWISPNSTLSSGFKVIGVSRKLRGQVSADMVAVYRRRQQRPRFQRRIDDCC